MQCFSAVKDASQQQAAATDRKLQSQQIPMLPVLAYDNPQKIRVQTAFSKQPLLYPTTEPPQWAK